MFLALKRVEATDAQRIQVMAAWDEARPRIDALGRTSADVLERWRALDRRDPAFASQAGALSARYGELSRERMDASAQFDGAIAGVLTEKQWSGWQREFAPGASRPGEDAGEGPRRRGGGGGRRR